MTLRITLEIVPFGVEDNKRVIETINISNVGIHGSGYHRYIVEHNEYKTGKTNLPEVLHKREDGAIRLAAKALEVVTFSDAR